MDNIKNVFCQLIREALFGEKTEYNASIDWEEVYREVKLQALFGLFSDMLPDLPLPENIRMQWENDVFSQYIAGVRVRSGQAELVDLLNSAQVPFVILKGTAAAIYYPKPDYRTMGDVDFLVKEKDYLRVQKLLEENGFEHSYVYQDNYRHESFNKYNVEFECHHSFADRQRRRYRLIDSLLINNIDHAVYVNHQGDCFPILPNIANGIVLIEHIAIHLGCGLGMRQIIDWMMYVDSFVDDDCWYRDLKDTYEKLGLDVLAVTVSNLCQSFFGLNGDLQWCKNADPDVCSELFDLIFDYGNFGVKTPTDNKVVAVISRSKSGFFKNLKTAGEHNWKALHRFPFLKPLAPIYQLGRYSVQAITTKGAIKGISSKAKKANKNTELFKKLGIEYSIN